MAIFSLNHSFVGRSTHAPGTASGHARYITRNEACTVILGERMPLDRSVYAWLDKEEVEDRKNARVIDRVTVALPSELSREQNIELLQEFGARMSQGRTPWMAAIHDGPGDADNPHAHLIFRDRDIETGRRVMMTTEPGSTERFRQGWEEEVNRALERAGYEVRVDRRSLEAQGIEREPQIHVGPAAQRLAEREHEFRSVEKQVTRLINGTPTEVTVNYPAIDEGKTRFEENEERKLRNWVREHERLAMEGPQRPESLSPAEQAHLATLRFDARYRQAMANGSAPAEDGDPITAVIRDHMAEREQGFNARTPPIPGGPIDTVGTYPVPVAEHVDASEERKGRQLELEKLKEETGLEQVLRARDYLNALTFERGEPPPGPGDLQEFLVGQDQNRRPASKERRPDSDERSDKPVTGSDPELPAVKRTAADAIGGAGLAFMGRLSDSVENLFDTRTGPEIEKDEKIMADQRKIEQITEQQQRQQEAEAAKWRQVELDLYLAQRDRERHIDRGR